jgi:hypothetical protein
MATLKDTVINDTGFATLPVGNTGARPGPTPGMIRYNTANNLLEFYDATGWRPITGVSAGSIGSGGQEILYATSNVGRANGVVHMFTTVGGHTFTPAFTGTVEVLVIGGGASGGGHLGAGGGAGGMIFNRSYPVSAGSGIGVTVGGGGGNPPAYSQSSNPGSNSVFGSITSTGGGGGGSWDNYAEDDCHQGLQANGGAGASNDILGHTLYWGGGGAASIHHGNSVVANSGGIGGGGGSTMYHGGPRQPGEAGRWGNGRGGGYALNTGGEGSSHYTGGNGGANTGGGGGGAYGVAGAGGSGIVIVKY